MAKQLFIGGHWCDGGTPFDVVHKATGRVVDRVPRARPEDLVAAVEAARRAAPIMAALPAHRRAELLLKVAQQIDARADAFAQTICAEAGKPLKYARAEVQRAIATFTLAGEEARRIHGETVPLDGVPAGEQHLGLWWRRPVGVVAAITPFNFPLNLVAHKVAPALAAGNSVILKPAELTPLSAVLLCEELDAAGVPPGAINLLHGRGCEIGAPLAAHPGIDKITFTGSRAVGQSILVNAGIKKVTLELGNATPVVIAADADLDLAARCCAAGAFAYAGQICISVQRIYVDQRVYAAFEERFLAATAALRVGDPEDDTVDVGPMIDEAAAMRACAWVDDALGAGARLACGGTRAGALMQPTVLTKVRDDMRVVKDEIFAPVCSLVCVQDFAAGLQRADAGDYALQAGVFTRDLDRAFQGVRGLNFGGVVINDTPSFRVDSMPYGGNRSSGLGREGVRYAIEDMTQIQMVAVRLGTPAP